MRRLGTSKGKPESRAVEAEVKKAANGEETDKAGGQLSECRGRAGADQDKHRQLKQKKRVKSYPWDPGGRT